MEWLYEYDIMSLICNITNSGSLLMTAVIFIFGFFSIKDFKNKRFKEKIVCIFEVMIIIATIVILIYLAITDTFKKQDVSFYSDKGTYFGSERGQEAHGKGIYFGEDDLLVYRGEFKNGKYDGEGKLYETKYENKVSKSMLVYEGNFKNGEKNGQGESYYDELISNDILML